MSQPPPNNFQNEILALQEEGRCDAFMFYSSTYVSLLFCLRARVHFESATQVINSRKMRRPFCLMADDVSAE